MIAFSPGAIETIERAKRAAAETHETASTTHLLVAIADSEDSVSRLMQTEGLSAERLREAATKIYGVRETVVGNTMESTPAVDIVLRIAAQEAELERSDRVEVRHLLLALLHRPGKALGLFDNLMIDVGKLEARISNKRDGGFPDRIQFTRAYSISKLLSCEILRRNGQIIGKTRDDIQETLGEADETSPTKLVYRVYAEPDMQFQLAICLTDGVVDGYQLLKGRVDSN